MLGLLTYCKEKGWIDYNVYEAGEKVIVFDIITREEREIAIDRKLAKLTIYNKYKYYDDMRERSKQIWIYFIQAIAFILVFSVSLATLLKM